MDSTIVIKVKHAKTLRRFNARVVNNGLELNLDGLRNKIRGLFNFSPDADLVLIYVDEDDDKITIGDDEDLRDVVKQRLNPLRISVILRNDNVARTPSESESVTRTPSESESVMTPRSSPVLNPFENLNSSVIEFINSLPEPISKRVVSSLPEPLGRGVMKILSDLASAGNYAGLSEVVQVLMEKGFSSPRQPSESGAATDSSVQARAPATENALLSAGAQEAGSSNGHMSEPELLSNEKQENPSSKTGVSIVNSNPVAITEAQSAPKSHETPKSQVSETNEVVKSGGPKESAVSPPGQKSEKEAQKEKAISEENGSVGKATKASPVVGAPTIYYPPMFTVKKDFQQPNMPQVTKPKEVDDPSGKAKKSSWFAPSSMTNSIPVVNSDSSKSYTSPSATNSIPVVNSDSSKSYTSPKPVQGFPFPAAPGFQTWTKGQPNTFSYPSSPAPQCPFLGTSIGNNPGGPYSRRSYGYGDGSGTIFHRGVRCDGCGVHPITGTRFKSVVKDDYDLCSICFAQMGVESDYMRIDRPATYHHPSHFPPRVYRAPQSQMPILDSYSANLIRPKLDSRFIQDVTILDGALMAPSTRFTKIWRMRNNGSLQWPWGTKLVWIGGDKMGDVFSVDLQIPGGIGFPVDQELDVAVDFIAPDRPGRYISYWRMRSPTGQKFGQRVWVLIQVDATLTAVQQALRDFNLNNMPSNTPSGSAPEVLEETEPLEDNVADLVKPVFDFSSQEKDDLIFPTNDNLLVGGGSGSGGSIAQPTSSASPRVSYPMIDLSDPFPSRPSAGTFVAPSFNDESDQTTELAPPLAQKPSTEVSEPTPVAVPEVSDPTPVAVTATAPAAPELPVVAANNEQTVQAEGEEENKLEKSLLMELDRMGFKEVDLNKEILRSNKYDLEKSLNVLCGESEWDHILEELHEMGFHDDVMNKKLLEKNKGSVTQVVLDLLVEEEQ